MMGSSLDIGNGRKGRALWRWLGGFLGIGMVAGVLGLGTFWVKPPKVDEISIEWEMLRGREILWVDARAEDEFVAGRKVKGAIRLDIGRYEEGFRWIVEEWDGKALLVVFCANEGCGISRMAAGRLRKDLGVDDVFALREGFKKIPEGMLLAGGGRR